MSQTKSSKEGLPTEAIQETPAKPVEQVNPTSPDSALVRDVTRETLFQTVPLQMFSPKELLSIYSLEFQQICSLHEEIAISEDLTFSEMKRKALGLIDRDFDIYRKQFALPDDLISMPIQCKEAVYYLSLYQGYLCFYQSIAPGPRLALRLVDRPKDYLPKLKN